MTPALSGTKCVSPWSKTTKRANQQWGRVEQKGLKSFKPHEGATYLGPWKKISTQSQDHHHISISTKKILK